MKRIKNIRDKERIDFRSLNNRGYHLWVSQPTIHKSRAITKIFFLLNPKKFFLYNNIKNRNLRILDFGSGSGSTTLELAHLKPRINIMGLEVSDKLYNEAVRMKKKLHLGNASFRLYDGKKIPFPAETFDAVISVDVFGHLPDLSSYLSELNRVLKPNGKLVAFSESKYKYIPIVGYLKKKGAHIDLSEEFHISLYSKKELRKMLSKSHFRNLRFYSPFLLRFFTHPERYRERLKETDYHVIKILNAFLFHAKRISGPPGKAFANIYSIIEMYTLGRVVETEGIFIKGIKKK